VGLSKFFTWSFGVNASCASHSPRQANNPFELSGFLAAQCELARIVLEIFLNLGADEQGAIRFSKMT
jgi:hypothetical protein